MAGVTPGQGGWAPTSRAGLALMAHPALPRWLARAEGEGRALVSLATIAAEAVTAAEVEAAVGALSVAIPVHIAAEERAGGMLAMAVGVAPDHAETLRRILDEHDALLRDLASLQEDSASRRDGLRALCCRVLEHERRESELLAAIADRVTSPVA